MGIRSWIGFAVIVLITVLLITGDALVLQPKKERLRALSRKLAVTEQEFAYVAGNTTGLNKIKEFVPRTVEGDNEAEQLFLATISEELQNSGMVLTRVEPKRVQLYGSYKKRSYKLDIEGGYRQFANFMRFLERMPEVVTIDSFEWHSRLLREQRRHSGTLSLTVIGY